MEVEKKKRLPHSGRIVDSATDFIQLSPEEARLIELKLALATGVRELRERNGLTQTEVAAKLGSKWPTRPSPHQKREYFFSVLMNRSCVLWKGPSKRRYSRI